MRWPQDSHGPPVMPWKKLIRIAHRRSPPPVVAYRTAQHREHATSITFCTRNCPTTNPAGTSLDAPESAFRAYPQILVDTPVRPDDNGPLRGAGDANYDNFQRTRSHPQPHPQYSLRRTYATLRLHLRRHHRHDPPPAGGFRRRANTSTNRDRFAGRRLRLARNMEPWDAKW